MKDNKKDFHLGHEEQQKEDCRLAATQSPCKDLRLNQFYLYLYLYLCLYLCKVELYICI